MGLSPILVEAIFRIIREINEQGTTVLLVEQNALMALSVAHRGYVLQTGEIVLSDTAANSGRTSQCERRTSANSDYSLPHSTHATIEQIPQVSNLGLTITKPFRGTC